MIALTVILLFNLQPNSQNNSLDSLWALSILDLILQFAALLMLIFAAIRRRNQINKANIQQDEDQNMISK